VKGKHAWRTTLSHLNTTTWVFLGVGVRRQNFLKDTLSFGDEDAWGFSSHNQTYTGGAKRMKSHNSNFQTQTIDWSHGHTIDVLLDLDEGCLRYSNLATRSSWKLQGLPKRSYAPHFNLFGANNTIKIEVIHPSEFGLR